MTEDDFILKQTLGFVRIKIPEGCVKCPECKGTGRIRWRWSEPSGGNDPSTSDYWTCVMCSGRGFVEESYLEFHAKMEMAVAAGKVAVNPT